MGAHRCGCWLWSRSPRPCSPLQPRSGTTTLDEHLEALPVERYRVEKYRIADPAVVDGDGIDDIRQLDGYRNMNPVTNASGTRARVEPILASWNESGTFSAASDHVCAVTETGEAICWGDNSYHQSDPPPKRDRRYTAISAALFRTCAVTEAREVACWGASHGVRAPSAERFTAVTTTFGHSCALTEDGEAVCWGDNDRGQADPPPGRYTAISAAGSHTCAVTQAGEAVC